MDSGQIYCPFISPLSSMKPVECGAFTAACHDAVREPFEGPSGRQESGDHRDGGVLYSSAKDPSGISQAADACHLHVGLLSAILNPLVRCPSSAAPPLLAPQNQLQFTGEALDPNGGRGCGASEAPRLSLADVIVVVDVINVPPWVRS